MDSRSWIVKHSECKDCGYNLIITQSKQHDYFWYCSNKYCKNHSGEELGDQEECSFAKNVPKPWRPEDEGMSGNSC